MTKFLKVFLKDEEGVRGLSGTPPWAARVEGGSTGEVGGKWAYYTACSGVQTDADRQTLTYIETGS